MIEKQGNIWDEYDADAIVITTNGFIKRDGRAVMGRGIAKQAAERFPYLPTRLGKKLRLEGNKVHVFEMLIEPLLVTLPVKHNWWEDADLDLIVESCRELERLANHYDWRKVVMPKPGCGNGRLEWEKVRETIEPFLDDRFVVMDFITNL